MADKEKRSRLLKTFVATSAVSASLVVSGFLLSGCGGGGGIVYYVSYVDPDTEGNATAPAPDTVVEAEVVGVSD